MNEENKTKIINWINFGGAVLSLLVKAVREILNLIPQKGDK